MKLPIDLLTLSIDQRTNARFITTNERYRPSSPNSSPVHTRRLQWKKKKSKDNETHSTTFPPVTMSHSHEAKPKKT